MTDDKPNKFKIKANEFKLLGIPWFDLPRPQEKSAPRPDRAWWKETDYGRKPPSPEFMARLPQLIADAQRELENEKREIAADVARAHEFLVACWRQQPPLHGHVDHLGRGCAQCLRPASPCTERCLRSKLHPDDPRSNARTPR
jgi:hypothetical protein